MTKKKNECKKCKHICFECKYFFSDRKCAAKPRKIVDCVTGDGITEYALCDDRNEKGDCKYFKKKEPSIEEQIIELLTKHDSYKCGDFGHISLYRRLANDMIHFLRCGRSNYIRFISTDDSPYSETVVATTDLMQTTVCMLSDAKNNYDEDDVYTHKVTKEENTLVTKLRRLLRND